MNKNEFINELDRRLNAIPYTDKKQSLEYYSELIDDYMDDGYSEKEAVSKVGNIFGIADEILAGYEVNTYQLNQKKPKRYTIPMIILLIITSPLWATLLLAAIMLLISALIVIWCVPFIFGTFAVTGIAASVYSIFTSMFAFQDGIYIGFMQIGMGLGVLGLALLSGVLTINISSRFSRISKNMFLSIKNLIRRRGFSL